jgi:hypothetical protein
MIQPIQSSSDESLRRLGSCSIWRAFWVKSDEWVYAKGCPNRSSEIVKGRGTKAAEIHKKNIGGEFFED